MSGNVTLSKASLTALIDGLYYDPNDYINPVIDWARWVAVLLNPQPLPPVPPPNPWRVAGPSPDPWRAAMLARTAIDRIVAEAQLAEASGEAAHDASHTRIAQLVDEFCGNRPPRWPWPRPWPPKLDPAQIRPVDLLVIGAQFQKAAEVMVENPLQADFAAAADQCLAAGLMRLESSR